MMRSPLCVYGSFIFLLDSFVDADLRMASQPKIGYTVRDQGQVKWNFADYKKMHYRYMEPSTFNYKGLEAQKARNYDNFLRSNIDNEQDNRNFNDEEGKDHLPFRTMETATFDKYSNNVNYNGVTQPDVKVLTKIVQPGESISVPLRWNNPHASEMEVNVWIFEHGDKRPVVVPIRKPSCSGEGYQDNIVSFTVPTDFKNLGAKIPGFKGCNEDSKPLCTLQIYSHSVESRTYAIGFPIVIPGHDAKFQSKSVSGIQSASVDPWLDVSGLRDLCLPATDSSANIPKAVPRWARLVSDVYNHAYQNSDYSPYSGQQQESISKNMQASAVNKMEVGNRGELGKSVLPTETTQRLNYLRGLENNIYKNYEALANTIIKYHGNQMANTGTIGVQQLARCFRCMEVGSTRTNRQQTNTYIPSFQLSKALIPAAKARVPAKYAGLISESGLVQIYVSAMKDLLPFFYQSRHMGIMYQEAKVKGITSTMIDTMKFKKRNANGQADNGVYAATMAKLEHAASQGCPRECLTSVKPHARTPLGNSPNSAQKCTWTKYENKYSGGYATNNRRNYGLAQAQAICVGYGARCGAVTCKNPASCSIRESHKLYVSPSGETTYQCQHLSGETQNAMADKCEWTKHASRYSRQQINGHTRQMRLNDAKIECLRLGTRCQAVTCRYVNAWWQCQVRASSQLSTSGAYVSYKPSVACQLGLPKGTLEGPLIKGAMATNVTGSCAPCAKLFGKAGFGARSMSKPSLTPLDKSILVDGQAVQSGVGGRLAANPNFIQSSPSKVSARPTSSRRRRRSALIQQHEQIHKIREDCHLTEIGDSYNA